MSIIAPIFLTGAESAVVAGKFRHDINGLRAWAVVTVILFHFGITGFEGGFVGVDVFFVISGFLMTSIVLKGLEAGSAAGPFLTRFYLSRARRIVPALAVLCLTLMGIGWFALPAVEYRQLATHAISALLFISNIQFWRESGYFDTDSHEKLLLHTWSLSVEWQFYILFPLVLLLLWQLRRDRRVLCGFLIAGTAISLAASIYWTRPSPVAAFFMLPTRAWELLAGGLVFMLGNKLPPLKWSRILELAGLLMILLAVVSFDAATQWPGWRALLPVTGTILVLLAGRQDSIWTGTRLAQWLGNASYSLYLWHWPFSVILVYLQLNGHLPAIAAMLVLTLVCGWLSWKYVEGPIRLQLGRFPTIPGMVAIASMLAIIVLPGLWIRAHDGLASRMPPEVAEILAEIDNKNPRRSECHNDDLAVVPECIYGGEQLGAIVIGDSHAASIIRSVEKALDNPARHVLDWTLPSCPTIANLKDAGDDANRCGKFIEYAYHRQEEFPASVPIIIVNRTSSYLMGPNEPDRATDAIEPRFYLSDPYMPGSTELIAELQQGLVTTACAFAHSRPVYMLRPIPELKRHVPNTMWRSLLWTGESRRVSITLDEYHRRHQAVWAAQNEAAMECGVKILDPLPYLCHDGRCWGDKNGRPLYYDDDHLSETGAGLLIPMFHSIFDSTDSVTPAIAAQVPGSR